MWKKGRVLVSALLSVCLLAAEIPAGSAALAGESIAPEITEEIDNIVPVASAYEEEEQAAETPASSSESGQDGADAPAGSAAITLGTDRNIEADGDGALGENGKEGVSETAALTADIDAAGSGETSEPRLILSAQKLSLKAGESATVSIAADDVSGNVRVKFRAVGDCVSASFAHGWTGNSIGLTAEGKTAGSGMVYIMLESAADGTILASTTLQVSVAAAGSPESQTSVPELSVSEKSITIDQASKGTIKLKMSDIGEKVRFSVRASSKAATATFRKTGDLTADLDIYGNKAGNVTFRVIMTSEDGRELGSTIVKAKINASRIFKVSKSSVSLQKGKTTRIRFTVTGVPDIVYLHRYTSDSHVKWTWNNDWKDSGSSSYITATLKGLKYGTAKFKIGLMRSRDDKLLATLTVKVTVKPANNVHLYLSTSSVSLKKGQHKDILVKTNASKGSWLHFDVSKEGIVDCSWLDTDDNWLRIKALKAGSVTVKVSVLSPNKTKTYISKGIKVQVTSGAKTYSVKNLGYSFDNSTDYFSGGFSLESFRMAFGNTTLAKNLWRKYGSNWNGSCFGMSTTALLIAEKKGLTASEFRSGASRAGQLKLSDKSRKLHKTLRTTIDAMQVSQYSSGVLDSLTNVDRNLSALASRAKKNQLTVVCYYGANRDPYTGMIYQVGHAVLAYKLASGSNADYVYVYDPNYANGSTRKITLYKSRGRYTKWRYNIGDYYTGTDYLYGEMYILDYNKVVKLWKKMGKIKNNTHLNMVAANADSFRVYDVEDKLVAEVKDNVLVKAADGVFAPKVMDAPAGESPVVYLPTRYYKVVKTSDDGKPFEVSMTNVELGASVTTGGNEVSFGVEDGNDLSKVIMEPGKDVSYTVELQSSRSVDPQETVIQGTGEGTPIEMSLAGGKLQTEGSINGTITMDGKTVQ